MFGASFFGAYGPAEGRQGVKTREDKGMLWKSSGKAQEEAF